MAAALLSLIYQGKSGRRYSISGYASDAANVLVKFDESKVAVAGSPDSYIVKEAGALVDVVFTSDLATPTHIQVQRNGTPTGDVFDVTSILASVTSRPTAVIPFMPGDKLALNQIS